MIALDSIAPLLVFMKGDKMPQCEGWRRRGGAFTLGPVKWSQCEEEAEVMLKIKQDNKTQEMPGCKECWQEAIEHKSIKVLSATPIMKETP